MGMGNVARVCLSHLFLFAMFMNLTPFALALPAQVVILRHAEKPEEGDHLSPKGYARAQALVGFWRTHPVVAQFGDPVAFYASYSPNKSVRSIETLSPSAVFYRRPLFSHFQKDQTFELAQEILNRPEFTDARLWWPGSIRTSSRCFGPWACKMPLRSGLIRSSTR